VSRDIVRLSGGYQAGPRDPLHAGCVGRTIRVYAGCARDPYVDVVAPVTLHAEYEGQEISVNGSRGFGLLSVERAEALIVELQLAVRACRLHVGEDWAEREIAPGVVRAPEVRER
jgi:hypothetical protein